MAFNGAGQDHVPVGPARFVSELIVLLDNPLFPAISWTPDGRQFHLDKVAFVAQGGGMSEICDSDDINSFIRQLHLHGIRQDRSTHCYCHPRLYRNAPVEVVALIQREKKTPRPRGPGTGSTRRRRRRLMPQYGEEEEHEEEEFDWGQQPQLPDGSEAFEGLEAVGAAAAAAAPVAAAAPEAAAALIGIRTARRGSDAVSLGAPLVAAEPPALGGAAAAELSAQLATLRAMVTSLTRSLDTAHAAIRTLSKLAYRQSDIFGYTFAQVPAASAPTTSGTPLPGLPPGTEIDLRSADAKHKPGELFLTEAAFVAAFAPATVGVVAQPQPPAATAAAAAALARSLAAGPSAAVAALGLAAAEPAAAPLPRRLADVVVPSGQGAPTAVTSIEKQLAAEVLARGGIRASELPLQEGGAPSPSDARLRPSLLPLQDGGGPSPSLARLPSVAGGNRAAAAAAAAAPPAAPPVLPPPPPAAPLLLGPNLSGFMGAPSSSAGPPAGAAAAAAAEGGAQRGGGGGSNELSELTLFVNSVFQHQPLPQPQPHQQAEEEDVEEEEEEEEEALARPKGRVGRR